MRLYFWNCRYACADTNKRLTRRDYELSAFYTRHWLPALHGDALDEASASVEKIYKSCSFNDFSPTAAFTNAAIALREALKLKTTNSIQIPALILKITALFRIPFFVSVRFTDVRKAPLCRVQAWKNQVLNLRPEVFNRVGDTAKVLELRDVMLNVSPVHSDVLGAVKAGRAESSGDTKRGSMVRKWAAGGGQMLWETALKQSSLWQPRMTIEVDEGELLQRLMHVFSVSQTDMAVFYVFHLAAWNLATVGTAERYTLDFQRPWQDGCTRELAQNRHLWAAVTLLKYPQYQYLENIISSFINELLSAVQTTVKDLFPGAEISLDRLLHFIFPSELFPPDWNVPEATDSYWKNKLVFSEWLQGVLLSPSGHDLQFLEKLSHGPLPSTAFFVDFTTLTSARLDLGDWVFVNDAIFGVDLATWVWKQVLDEAEIQNRGNVSQFMKCLWRFFEMTFLKDVPLFLAVRTVLEMHKTPDWNTFYIPVGRLKPFSKNKLFFVTYFNRLCENTLQGLESKESVRSYGRILSFNEQFQSAFKCLDPFILAEFCFHSRSDSLVL
ncbi:hypothetical protein HPB48_019844 [Haemaphysalis longicornis]|uniref:Uncharacterized protein n=1 Tax=Haemaphysalis longicornis TaxID=44386 RepID=A0A9J6GJ87_HAELO|nr:hypothetical protein HPB48_019844 [Haemaphysalis longicornis]